MLGMLMLEIVICIRQRHTCSPYPTDRGEPLWKESICTVVLQAMVHYQYQLSKLLVDKTGPPGF